MGRSVSSACCVCVGGAVGWHSPAMPMQMMAGGGDFLGAAESAMAAIIRFGYFYSLLFGGGGFLGGEGEGRLWWNGGGTWWGEVLADRF